MSTKTLYNKQLTHKICLTLIPQDTNLFAIIIILLTNSLLFVQAKQRPAVGYMANKCISLTVITRRRSCKQAEQAAGSERVLSSDTLGKQGSPDLFTTLSSCFSKWILLLTRHIQATHTHTYDQRLLLLQL